MKPPEKPGRFAALPSRAATSTGRPPGSESFLGSIKKPLKKRVRPIGRQKSWRKHPNRAQTP